MSNNTNNIYRIYTEKDSDLPTYPEDFQVAKYSIFKKVMYSGIFTMYLVVTVWVSAHMYSLKRLETSFMIPDPSPPQGKKFTNLDGITMEFSLVY